MKYKSKKDLFHTIIVACILPLISVITLINELTIMSWVILVFCFLFPFWVWKSTYYEISDGYLTARIMFLRTKFKISEITLIRETENIWSSYALSLKRLEIKTRWDVIYISPLDKEGFLEELKSHNPNIQSQNVGT